MVISIMDILLYAKVSLLYNVLWEWLCCCLQVNCIVYKHFDRLMHIGLLDPTCGQKFRSAPLTVFEIQGLKTEQQEEEAEEQLEKWIFWHISHVSGPILTKFLSTHTY